MQLIEHPLPPGQICALHPSAVRQEGSLAYVMEADGPKRRADAAVLIRGYLSTLSYYELTNLIALADADPSIDRTVLVFDTPGGAAAGVAEAAAAIAQAKKPVIGYALGRALSSGMWLFSACHERYASVGAELGSIGVWSLAYLPSYPEGGQLAEDLFLLKSSRAENKVFPKDREKVLRSEQGVIDRMESLFFNAISGYTGKSEAQILEDFGLGEVRLATQVEGYATITPMASVLFPESVDEQAAEPVDEPSALLAEMAAEESLSLPPGAGNSVIEVAQKTLRDRVSSTRRR